jgi:hypothetical protein
MAEELRFFLRTAMFALVVGTIYWFVSYEWVGTVLFGFVVIGAGFFAAAIALLLRSARGEVVREERGNKLIGALNRTIGFEEHPDEAASRPLEIEEHPFPTASAWPLAAALAGLLIGLGLVFGAWFWLPGVALAAATLWGWLTELVR